MAYVTPASTATNVIFVSPSAQQCPPYYEGAVAASAAITPGMLVETHLDTTTKMRPHSADTRIPTMLVADASFAENRGIADVYAIGDYVLARWIGVGHVFNGIVLSGQNIDAEELLQSNGDGKFKTASAATADAGLARFQAKQTIGAVTADTRCLVMRIS